jgi:hypothetical protein
MDFCAACSVGGLLNLSSDDIHHVSSLGFSNRGMTALRIGVHFRVRRRVEPVRKCMFSGNSECNFVGQLLTG